MSTFTFASASARKMRAGGAGLVGHAEQRDPRLVGRMGHGGDERMLHGLLFSETTTVPGPSSKLERQWIRTPWVRAYSTERSWSTPAPEAAISSISSKETIGSLRASGTIRGSALNTPATSV